MLELDDELEEIGAELDAALELELVLTLDDELTIELDALDADAEIELANDVAWLAPPPPPQLLVAKAANPAKPIDEAWVEIGVTGGKPVDSGSSVREFVGVSTTLLLCMGGLQKMVE